MAAGQGTSHPDYVFNSDLFYNYVTRVRAGERELYDVFQTVRSAWRGRADWEITDKGDGVKFLVGPDQSSYVSITATVDPDTGDIKFTRGSMAHVRNFLTQGLPHPWSNPASERKIITLMKEFVEDSRQVRGRDVRGFAEASKSFEFGSKGQTLPESAQSNIASFLTGEKATAGPPQEQMRKLRDKADPDYAEELEERRSQEILAAMKGGRRKKTKRSSKKRRMTRRR
jgi:hypothetical protein